MLQTFEAKDWQEVFSHSDQNKAISCLENGQILFFPKLTFTLSKEERNFLSPDYADPHAKNISYQINQNRLWGVQHLNDTEHLQLKGILDRFAQCATSFVKTILPQYARHLIVARTSYRPLQISNRQTSYRKDDKRLHVDAFPSAPNQGKRILRIFCNINPLDAPRVWRVGEPFETVAAKFLPRIKAPFPGTASLLRLFKITKSLRTLYDHYMLRMHDLMKADDYYQKHAKQETIPFPGGSSWIVQTDHVSHAAMQGQYVLEQTFYLPIHAMQDSAQAPVSILERLTKRKLV